MRKRLAVFLIFAVLTAFPASALAQGGTSSHWLRAESSDKGLLQIQYNRTSDNRIKLKVEKDGQKYYYDLLADSSVEKFPLQMGGGEYKVSILENIQSTQYKVVATQTLDADIEDDKDVYLQSVQNVTWNSSMKAVKKAEELTSKLSGDEEKVRAVYNFIIRNYEYDYDKMSRLDTTYVPDMESFYSQKKGICYDYASMFAAMLRSIGIPAKLVKGYAESVDGYHAWNEVYLESKGRWVVIDTTTDSVLKNTKTPETIFKDSNHYTKTYEY